MKITVIDEAISNLEAVKDAPALNVTAKAAIISSDKYAKRAEEAQEEATDKDPEKKETKKVSTPALKQMKLAEALFDSEELLEVDGRQFRVDLTKEQKAEEESRVDSLAGRLQGELDKDADWNEQKYNIVKLKQKQKYEHVYFDVNGNVVIAAPSRERLIPATAVAQAYNLEYTIKPSTITTAMAHPELAYECIIYLDEE